MMEFFGLPCCLDLILRCAPPRREVLITRCRAAAEAGAVAKTTIGNDKRASAAAKPLKVAAAAAAAAQAAAAAGNTAAEGAPRAGIAASNMMARQGASMKARAGEVPVETDPSSRRWRSTTSSCSPSWTWRPGTTSSTVG